MLLLTQEELGFHPDGLGDESAWETFVTLETFEQFLAGHVARVELRKVVLDRGIPQTSENTTAANVLFDGDDADVTKGEIVNVTIDMIRHHAIGDAAEPGICHQLVETISVSMPVNIRVTLSLTATATGMETFAVGVLLPEVDTTIAQPHSREGIDVASLREEETDTVIRLAKACAVTEDQLTMVVRIELKPQEWLWLPWFSASVAQQSLLDAERFAFCFHLRYVLCLALVGTAVLCAHKSPKLSHF